MQCLEVENDPVPRGPEVQARKFCAQHGLEGCVCNLVPRDRQREEGRRALPAEDGKWGGLNGIAYDSGIM